MNVVKKEDVYTIEDIHELPDGEREEILDGQIYYMLPLGTNHQRLVKEFTYQIENYIRNDNGECEIFPVPFAVFLKLRRRAVMAHLIG